MPSQHAKFERRLLQVHFVSFASLRTISYSNAADRLMNELTPVVERPEPEATTSEVAPRPVRLQAAGEAGSSLTLSVLDNRWLVVGLLLVAGPIGLPALWFSRRFSTKVKVGTTILYAIVTVVFPLAMVWYWCETAVRPLVDALVR